MNKGKEDIDLVILPRGKTKAPAKTQTLIFVGKDALFVCLVGVIVPERRLGKDASRG